MEMDLLFMFFIDNHQCNLNKGPSNFLERKDTLDKKERLWFLPKCNHDIVLSKEKNCDSNNGDKDIVEFEEDTNEHHQKHSVPEITATNLQ